MTHHPSELLPAELMALVIGRSVDDGTFAGIGAASQIPMAGIRLAQLTRAPNIVWFSGGSGAINPRFDRLRDTPTDYRNLLFAEATINMQDVVDYEMSSRLDYAFFGGMQIDMHGNVNMVAIGDHAAPKVRGPGTIGTIFMGGFKYVYLFVHRHDPQVLVEQVDFIGGPGHLSGGTSRSDVLRGQSGGPRLLITPLAVFDFEDPSRRARLRQHHPDVTVDEVVDRTGFTPLIADDVAPIAPPTPTELTILRDVIDPDGVLRRLIPDTATVLGRGRG